MPNPAASPRPAFLHWKDVARLLRPHQWLKNLLVFVPAFTAHHFDWASAELCALAFCSFSLCASAGYVFNDLLDIDHDQQHPTKRNRPFASGRINRRLGLPFLVVLLALALAVSILLPLMFFVALAAYFVLTLLYSLLLKKKMMLDVMALALLYGVRLAAGAVVVDVPISVWLLSFATFLFVSLALIKRVTELMLQTKKGGGDPAGRGYQLQDLPVLESMAAASGYVAALTAGLYISSPIVTQLYDHAERLWAIPIVMLFWVGRVLILTHRGDMHDDPVLFAAKDRVSLLCGGLMVAAVIVSI